MPGRDRSIRATQLGVARLAVALALIATVPALGQQRGGAFNVEEATIGDLQQALLRKQVTTVGIVERYLERIKAYNGTCVNEPQGILGPITTIPHARQINALSTINLRPAARGRWGFDARKARSLTDAADAATNMPDALEAAAAQDDQFRRTGRLAGPLHGVVLAIKAPYDTFDMRTTSGGDVDYANDRPPDDATFVARLRAAGAIILAKANLAEYAVDGARSSFGGTFCNPYDTEREPGMSSAGSASSVAANLVTCSIGEETVVSIRWPASVNSVVGIAPTVELVSHDGMMGSGLNMRTGPMCRTVQDAAKILDVIAGYDPKDELTVFSVGRKPAQGYAAAASARRLDGLRIGVIREYMNRALFSKADEQSITLAERAIDQLRTLGAAIVDPGPNGALFQTCLAKYGPELLNTAFAAQFRQQFPIEANRQPSGDHLATLLAMKADPSRVPPGFSLRSLNTLGTQGEGRYTLDRYLLERGDANIKSNADLIAKARFYSDPNFPDRRQAREAAERARELDTSGRLHTRFALQTTLLQCMQEQRLDALVSPTSTVPPRKLTSPREPAVNGRPPIGWSLIGQQGFPAITVPAGFTTDVWDRERDGQTTKLVGPIPARLPVGVDFIARPFDEALLVRIGAAYEAATKNRRPPEDFVGLARVAAQSGDGVTRLADGACAGLQNMMIPASAIGLPTGGAVVRAAAGVAASDKDNPNGDFCKVSGSIKPTRANSPGIEFEVNLPRSWNRRALQMGGGGYDGTLVTGLTGFTLQPASVANPLRQGFVTLGTDGGHQSAAGFDGSFAMDDEALRNFGRESVKKGHDAAMAIIRQAYGRAPDRFYFIGGSQGGHEALDAAARYPRDYDGVVANYPAYNVTLLHLGSLNAGKALYEGGGAAWMNPAKVKLITDAVYAQCDSLDGVKDGIVSNVKACARAFDVKTLRCAGGGNQGDSCLSDAQLAAVARITSDYTPGFAIAGMDTFPKWALLEGALFRDRSNFGQVPQPSNPLSGKEPLLYTAGDQTVKFIITRNPQFDTMTFDPREWQARIAAVAAIMDVSDVSLETFKAKGGKIILTHGTADDFITPHNTELYYGRQVKQFGQAGVDSFIRFYMIPGFGHGFGPFNAKIDSLTALQAWVEKGQAPSGLVAIDGNPNAARSRPLCESPKWPKFTGEAGAGDTAASFTCVAP
jgi:Asp-tRNA(Asn)/Glu-tRNA(Gln) amidotransferase A subunit family amidase